MRGSTLARRAAGVAAAALLGLGLVAGCGSDPAEISGNGNGTGDGSTSGGQGGAPQPGSTGTDGTTPGTGGPGGTGGGATGTKPCSLVTVQDASQALGATASNTSDTAEECLYEAGNDQVNVALTLQPFDRESVEQLTMLGPSVQRLDGVGDAAFRISLGPETQYHVWTHGKYAVLIVSRESGDTEAPAKTLFDKVLPQL